MNIFKYIFDYFKRVRSRFRKSNQNKATIQLVKENTGKQIKDVEGRLQDLITQEENEEQIVKAIEEKTAIEIGQELSQKVKEPIFDLVEIKNEVRRLNQKLFEIDVQKRKIGSIQVPPKLRSDEAIERLEKLFKEFSSENNTQSNREIFKGLDENKTEIDSFFEEFKLIKIYKRREEKRELEEQVKKQKINQILSQLEQAIKFEKLDNAKQGIRIAERAILRLSSSQQKTKFYQKLSKLIEIFRKKEIELEAIRQAEILKDKKEAAEQKRKEKKQKIQKERVERLNYFENNTVYSNLINKENFKFNCIKSMGQNYGDEVFESLERGTAILYADEQMRQYVHSYGNMHYYKLKEAFEACIGGNAYIPNGEKIEIIDWGCGQGFGTVCLMDRLKQTTFYCSIERVYLIEPSEVALKRAGLHVKLSMQSKNQKPEIIPVNKFIDKKFEMFELSSVSTKFHIFSNILDVEEVDLKSLFAFLSQNLTGINYFVCVSPLFGSFRDARLDFFLNQFKEINNFELISKRKNQADTWISNWTRNEAIFRITF